MRKGCQVLPSLLSANFVKLNDQLKEIKEAGIKKVHYDVMDGKNVPNVAFGTHIQTKYQEYWFNKGELEEGKATPQVLFEFRKFSGYDKCLYLVTEKSIEKSSRPDLFTRIEKTRATINIKGYLVGQGTDGKDTVLKLFNVVASADSDTSDLRAKRGAMEKAMKELVLQYNEYLRRNK